MNGATYDLYDNTAIMNQQPAQTRRNPVVPVLEEKARQTTRLSRLCQVRESASVLLVFTIYNPLRKSSRAPYARLCIDADDSPKAQPWYDHREGSPPHNGIRYYGKW